MKKHTFCKYIWSHKVNKQNKLPYATFKRICSLINSSQRHPPQTTYNIQPKYSSWDAHKMSCGRYIRCLHRLFEFIKNTYNSLSSQVKNKILTPKEKWFQRGQYILEIKKLPKMDHFDLKKVNRKTCRLASQRNRWPPWKTSPWLSQHKVKITVWHGISVNSDCRPLKLQDCRRLSFEIVYFTLAPTSGIMITSGSQGPIPLKRLLCGCHSY